MAEIILKKKGVEAALAKPVEEAKETISMAEFIKMQMESQRQRQEELAIQERKLELLEQRRQDRIAEKQKTRRISHSGEKIRATGETETR